MPLKPSWDEYFISIAKVVSTRSACLKALVGAVIISPSSKIVSTGYNSPPHGVDDSISIGFCNKERLGFSSGEGYEFCRSIHAEQNAIIQAGADRCNGATIYIWGHDFICNMCKKFILQAGIKNYVLQKDHQTSPIYGKSQDWITELKSLVPL